MIRSRDFEQLKRVFSLAGSLPPLPGAALKLIQILECEETSSVEIERIIMGDPSLTAAVLRAASSALFGGQSDNVTTVRGAVARLGQRALHSVAVSLVLQDLMMQSGASPSFDRLRFARHSIFVGMMARYQFAARSHRQAFSSRWSRDEIFAAGVLHDLATGLLARVDHDAFEHVHGIAQMKKLTLQDAFKFVYGQEIYELGAIACDTWKLPSLFGEILNEFHKPFDHKDDLVGLCCLHYANSLADQNTFGMQAWTTTHLENADIEVEVGLPLDDLPNVIMLVSRHTIAYVPLSQAA